MRKSLILFFLMFFSISECFAYAMKVYDEYGNRIGTYRKEGDGYQLYDCNDKKVTNPKNLRNTSTKRNPAENTITYYDGDMQPIGTWNSGVYRNRTPYFVPADFAGVNTPSIIRTNGYRHPNHGSGIRIVDTRYPKLHKFKY